MIIEEFKKYIKSIGFKFDESIGIYRNDNYVIVLYNFYYDLYINDLFVDRFYNSDLTPLRKLDRSYKLKQLLG